MLYCVRFPFGNIKIVTKMRLSKNALGQYKFRFTVINCIISKEIYNILFSTILYSSKSDHYYTFYFSSFNNNKNFAG